MLKKGLLLFLGSFLFLSFISVQAESSVSQDEVEKLVKQGEGLINLKDFPEALKVFEQALELDSNHDKANFYAGFLKPFTLFEGLAPRVLPLLTGLDSGLEEFLKQLEEMKKDADKYSLYLPQFLAYVSKTENPDGTPIKPWESIGQAQDYLSREGGTLDVLEEAVARLTKANLNENFSIRVNFSLWLGDKTGDVPNKEFEVNGAEVALVRAAFQLLLFAGNGLAAYELDTFVHVSKNLGEEATFQKVVEELRKEENSKALLLRGEGAERLQAAHRNLTGVFDSIIMALDLAVAEVTRGDDQTDDLLPVRDLYEAAPDFKPVLQRVRTLISTRYEAIDPHTKKVVTVLNIPALFDGSVTDLKVLLPSIFDEEGKPIGWEDNTLGGIFPQGDWPEAMDKLAQDPEIRELLQIILGLFKR